MESQEIANQARSRANRAYTRKRNEVLTAINAEDELELIIWRFEECKDLWKVVQQKHEEYISAIDQKDIELLDTEENWLIEVQQSFLELERTKLRYQKRQNQESHQARLEEQEKEEERKKLHEDKKRLTDIQNAYKLREIEAASFYSQAEYLNEILKSEAMKEKPLLSIVKDTRDDLKKQLEICKRAHNEYVMQLDTQEIQKETKWSGELQRMFIAVNQKVGEILQAHEKLPDITRKKSIISNPGIKLERMKLPSFNGNIRDYPRFKSDFIKQVLPQISNSDSAAYTLKSCLGGIPYDLIRNVDDSLDQMWQRLDERYGRTSKLTETIMFDIKKIKAMKEGEEKKFVEFVDVVERGYRDLSYMKVEHELSNTTVISLLEEKLPKDIRREWSKRVNEIESKTSEVDRFTEFLQFLLNQKRIIEYESADIRMGMMGISGHAHLMQEEDKDHKDNDHPKMSRCLVHDSNTHSTINCRAYMEKTPAEKVELIKIKRACWSCLKIGHRSADCHNRKKCLVDGSCNKYHHESLHQAHIDGIVFHTTIPTKDHRSEHEVLNNCLLQLMRVNSGTIPQIGLNILWDGGATISLITFSKARDMGLVGEPIKISVVKVGGQKQEMSSYLYELPVMDKEGNVINFQVYGIDRISTEVSRKNLDNVRSLFKDLDHHDIRRPSGEIDVLIGFEYAGFHPVREQSNGHLLVLSNRFGRCIGGSHSLLKENTRKVIQHVTILHVKNVRVEDFYEMETMGVECSPKCGSCRCGKCPIGGKQYTLQEERELHKIEEGLTLRDGHWEAKYPWIRDPIELPNNKVAAVAMLKSTERRLARNTKHSEVYCSQIQDMIERGIARKLSQDEMNSYKGPIFYLSHHEVIKPDSESTPCRIVFNSSANFKGHILNDYWAKGPDLLNNLLGILIRFRENSIALTADIKKMYHAVKITEQDQHTHRFLWRNMDVAKEPDTYVITAVSFGDRPAGNIATMALRKTAEMEIEKYPSAAAMIIKNTYVDDLVDSVKSVEEASKLANDVDYILQQGGFTVKHWTMSNPDQTENSTKIHLDQQTNNVIKIDINAIESYDCKDTKSTDNSNIDIEKETIFKGDSKKDVQQKSKKVLGMCWVQSSDDFQFTVKLNFSPRRRKIHTGPNLELQEIPHAMPAILTKRMVLSQINGIYDPLGLATPFTIKAKLLMRELWSVGGKHLEWDDDIPSSIKVKWISFFQELFEMRKLSFKRCIQPADAEGDAKLIMFSDASEQAFGTCAYVRWELPNGKFESRLIAAKSRVAPTKKISVVRLELNAAVMSKRLCQFIKEETRLNFEKEVFIVDSEIVRAMLQKESYGFNTYAAIRIGEIQTSTKPEDWKWVESKWNIADWTTRGKQPGDLDEKSMWQNGPEFLQKPESQWPISSDCNIISLPEQNKLALNIQIAQEYKISNCIDINRYSSFNKLIRVTARILSIFDKSIKPSLKNLLHPPGADLLKQAELIWIKDAQIKLKEQIKKGYLCRLNPIEQKGIIKVGGRAEKWMQISYDNRNIPLLPKDHRLSFLYSRHIHQLSHLGISATMSKIRLRYWICGLARIVKSIKHHCVTCRRLDKEFAEQKMAQLPEERLKPSAAWQYTSVDLFGPYSIKGEVNKRSRGKAYGIIFNCITCRAVYVDVATDYSTEGFLIPFRRFVTIRGYPQKIISDSGSQLVGASKELNDIIKGLNQATLKEFGAEAGLEWYFTTPDGPWRNGCSESLIKSIKKAISCAIGNQILSLSEFQTVCFEAANLVNERPIGRHPTSPDDGSYLSPNHLILGRATTRIPAGPFKEPTSLKHRFEFVEKIVDTFWRRWTRDYFPNLIIHPKWHTQKRNVKIGDIVVVQDSNQIRGNWILAKVSNVFPGKDGLVRHVELQYKNQPANEQPQKYKGKSYTTIERPVQRLIVIVPIDETDVELP